jgi:Tfp pilus assembly protein PilO
MTPRDRNVVLVLLVAAILGGSWFGVLKPKRAALSKVTADIATQQGRLDKARAAESSAQAARRRYDRDYATVARLGKAVPTDDGVASLVYQLDAAAGGAKVDFRSLKLGTSSGAPAASASSSAPATQAAAATLPPGASVGAAGFPTLPFSFVFDGSFFDMERFLRNVDNFTRLHDGQLSVSGRLLTIDGISLTAGRLGFPHVKATLAATAYLLPAEEGATNGATAAGPATGSASGGATGTAAGATASASSPTTNGAG